MTAEHRAKVRYGKRRASGSVRGQTFQVTCSCGFLGVERAALMVAEKDLRSHEADPSDVVRVRARLGQS